ncbi:acetyltransferase [Cohnella phaseoli]|uniref:Sugar O-acyltransferase (Sialic acid O-acetyltransferase NeuD family) n=1 Tax=Cohnella phaseoli TaxID=456490 RepID=A0A3D9KET6_9BACL|nr:acetyltransferase [Cohnella phaseoli]RED84036.1 sugar O-acyltransferase (sialic acid O-acetyltransferase NeuD family) [Cohnella phaseoli]
MKPLIIMGGGGHAKVIAESLSLMGLEEAIIGFTALDGSMELFNMPYIGDDSAILEYNKEEICLINAVGSTGRNQFRTKLFKDFHERGFAFANVVHPAAILSKYVTIGVSVQIMAGAIIQSGTRIGDNVIVNTGSRIDHDCIVGNHVHVSPGAILCGSVVVEDEVHIGAGATVIQGITLGRGSIVGAGAVVIKNVLPYTTVVGIPAREVQKRNG